MPKPTKNIAILLCLFVFLSKPVFAESGAFTDTDHYAWKDSIDYLEAQEVVQGYSDGTFKPDQSINRAEFLKIVIEGRGLAPSDEYTDSCFPDVPEDEWFTEYICYAKELGFIGGYPDGTFKPEKSVNQAEALKIVLNVFDQALSPEREAIPSAQSGAWYMTYLQTAKDSGMEFFAPKNPAGYQISRGEMAYFTAWIMNEEEGTFMDQIPSFSEEDPFVYIVDGSTTIVKMDANKIKMKVMSGNDSLRPQDADNCSITGDCRAESQAESFTSFVGRSHSELLVNGSYFDAYSLPLNGTNYHEVGSDIVMSGELKSMFGYPEAFGGGGMLAQWLDGDFKFYSPIREWTEDLSVMNFAISNYPLVLMEGEVRTKEEIGKYADNDDKFWVSARRGGLGISEDGETILYVSAVGTVQDLGQALLDNGAYSGFALDAGGSGAFFMNGKTLLTPGRNLTTVIEFFRYK